MGHSWGKKLPQSNSNATYSTRNFAVIARNNLNQLNSTQFEFQYTCMRYTPHYQWNDSASQPYEDAHFKYDHNLRQSAWGHMIRDAQRYVPGLSECQYQRSIWEVKTILPRSDSDDSRPILFRANHGLKGLHCVMGGKIDNIYDALQEIERVIELSE